MIEIQRTAGEFGKREQTSYKIRLIGLGGAGLNIMSRVASEGGDAKLMTVLDTDVRALKSSRAAVRLQLGGEVTHGMGCGGDPDLGRESAEMSETQIREMLRGSDLVFLCVGLGGGTGSGTGPVIARIAKEEGCFVIAAVTLPFHFEGRRRQQQAMDSLTELRNFVGALLTFENDRMGDLIVPSSGVQEAFAAADRMISQSVRAISVLLDRPGMIRVTLEDLLSILNGKDAKCYFGFGEAEGASRAERATTEALAHHLKEHSGGLAEASSVLIHLAGDHSVTFAEVEQVTSAVAEKTNEACKVLLGVSASQDLGKKLSVAIIASVDQNRRLTKAETEPRGQELHVAPLVNLPPLVRTGVPLMPAVHAVKAAVAPGPPLLVEPQAPVPRTVEVAAPKPVVKEESVTPFVPLTGAAAGRGGPMLPPPPPPPAPLPVEKSRPSVFTVAGTSPGGVTSPPSLGGGERGKGGDGGGSALPGAASGAVPLASSTVAAQGGSGVAPQPPRPVRTAGSLGDPLDFPTGKGRFEGTEPTKVDGVDLDWPTFLRKKRAAQG